MLYYRSVETGLIVDADTPLFYQSLLTVVSGTTTAPLFPCDKTFASASQREFAPAVFQANGSRFRVPLFASMGAGCLTEAPNSTRNGGHPTWSCTLFAAYFVRESHANTTQRTPLIEREAGDHERSNVPVLQVERQLLQPPGRQFLQSIGDKAGAAVEELASLSNHFLARSGRLNRFRIGR